MTKLTKLVKQTGNDSQRRFLTPQDLAIIKHDASVKLAKEKRGEVPAHPNNIIRVCGCGAVGCAVHYGYDNQ